MKLTDVRNWLGLYFLLTTVFLGAYILLFAETRLLPISKKDSLDGFQIIIPVFVAQLTTAFTWFGDGATSNDTEDVVGLPPWVVKVPPLLVVSMIVLTIGAMIVSENRAGAEEWVDASTFKAMVTFCVTVLNATTVLIVIRVFRKPKVNQGGSGTPIASG